MIEQIMYVGIGFLVAGLLVIGVIPLVHARAVRLTMRRLEALTPLSMAEIQAEKDQLRAEFAMSTSRLEMNVEQLKAKSTSQLAEIGRKSEAIGRLKFELGEKTAELFALEAKERQLAEDLRSVEGELAARTATLAETERMLAGMQAEFTHVSANLHQNSIASDSQQVELMALRAQNEALKGQIESYEKETQALWDHLNRKTAEAEAVSQQLAEERGQADGLANRIGELDRQLVAQTTESEVLGRRVQELAARLDEQGRSLADREYLCEQLRNEATSAQASEARLRAELADAEARSLLAAEAIKFEKSLIEDQLKQSYDERVKLQRELAAMRRDAENGGPSERMESENAALRERINDVAAEVARLTATLEGADSPIETILNSSRPAVTSGGAKGISPPIAPRTTEAKGTLADRIRALQGRAARVARPGPEPEPGRGAARSAQQRR